MGYGYSVDLRERVVKCVKELNLTYVAAASMFSVSVASVNRWLRKERETGSLEPKEYGGGRSHAIKDGRQLNRLKKIIESQPDATIAEITAKKINAHNNCFALISMSSDTKNWLHAKKKL